MGAATPVNGLIGIDYVLACVRVAPAWRCRRWVSRAARGASSRSRPTTPSRLTVTKSFSLTPKPLRTTRRGLHCPSSAGNTVASWALSPVLPVIETRRRPLYDGGWNMISVRTKKITFGVLLTGLLTTTTACALHAQTRQASEVKPSSPTNGTSTLELVPVSAPTTSEPRDVRQSPETPAPTEGSSNSADDPRAVIDWLLNQRR